MKIAALTCLAIGAMAVPLITPTATQNEKRQTLGDITPSEAAGALQAAPEAIVEETFSPFIAAGGLAYCLANSKAAICNA